MVFTLSSGKIIHIILLPFITVSGIIFLFTSNSCGRKTLSNRPPLWAIQTLFLGCSNIKDTKSLIGVRQKIFEIVVKRYFIVDYTYF